MHITSHLPFVVDVRSSKDAQGYPCATLMLKATYSLPAAGQAPAVAQEQMPWFHADEPVDESGTGAPAHEADLPYEKPYAEFLVVGQAHAPQGIPTSRFTFGVTVGQTTKRMNAVGARTWRKGLIMGGASDIEPTRCVPVSYAYGFGGIDPTSPEDDQQWCETSFAGTGFCAHPDSSAAHGMRLPQLEPVGQTFKHPCKRFASLGLGPVGRAWAPRKDWAGTYDQAWQDSRWPNLPLDFDTRFFQSAAQDQWLQGELTGQSVELLNMTPADSAYGSSLRFTLPALDYVATLMPHRGERTKVQLRADTLVLEPDAGRFCIIARKQVSLDEGLHEIREVEFGEPPQPLRPPERAVIALDDFIQQLRRPKPQGGR